MLVRKQTNLTKWLSAYSHSGEVGFLSKCFDVEDLAEKINEFFNHDESWFKVECEKSKKYASKFSWEKTATEIERIYNLVLN